MKRAETFSLLMWLTSCLLPAGFWPLALANEDSFIQFAVDDLAKSCDEQLENELKRFLAAKSGSNEEEVALRRIEERKPTAEDLRTALDRAHRSGKDAKLKPGISHDHTFDVAGVELSASLYVPVQLHRPTALWVIPAHPSQTLNSDKTFQFMLVGLPRDALVLWVHLYDATTTNPDTPAGKRYGRGVRNDRQRAIDHCDVFAAAVAMALSRFQVDPNRVYCWGVSASGNATWWNGVRLPDVFAGICPCDTNPTQVVPWMGSLLQTRAGILHGEKDDRCPVEVLRRVDKELQRLDVERRFVEVAGGRHGRSWRYQGPGLCAWIAERARDPDPPKIIFFPDRIGDRCFWLEALALGIAAPEQRPLWGQPPARVSAEVRDDGTIDVTARGVKRLRVWLDEDVASIRVNKTEVKDEPSLRLHEALLHAKGRRDPQLLRVWAVDVEVPATAPNGPGTSCSAPSH